MEAIILAGGFGTRLSHIVSDVPKPMAPVDEKPFLKYIVKYLVANGVKHIVFATGYKGDIIKNYFGNEFNGIKITYSVENTPLGTGGAIKQALEFCNDDNVFILNGDTYYDVKLIEMSEFHLINNSNLTIAVKEMKEFDRYGSVIIKDNKIIEFVEKKAIKEGLINGGTYLINRKLLQNIEEKSFSFENQVLESGNVELFAFECDGYFIDIGVPEDYYKAQIDFKRKNEKEYE